MAKRPALIWIVTLVTLASGAANLYSAIHPRHHARHPILHDLLPLEFLHFPRSFTLLVGLALIVSAINIYKRKQRAWQIVLALSGFSVFFHLLRGRDHEQAWLSLALVVLLLALRRSFTVKSRLPDWRAGLLRFAVALVAAFGYGVAGFWLLDRREFGIDFNWADSIHRTLLYLALIGDPSLTPQTRYAEWFLDSLYAMTLAVIGYGLWSLFRPILYRFHTLPQERARAKEILDRHGHTSLDFFKLWPDKSYFFNSTHDAFIAYRVGLNFAIALADPVGPETKIEETIKQFKQYCEDQGWNLAFHQTLPDLLPVYRRLGFKKLKIGDEAIVDLTGFTLSGSAMKRMRQKINQFDKAGCHVERYEPPLSDELLRRLKEVSDEWLRIPGKRERAFSLGMFEPHYLRSTAVITAEDAAGKILAFANFIPSHHCGEATVDLMRHRQDAPNGVMDYLFIKIFLDCRERGFTRFSLGLAPLDGFKEREEASVAERTVYLFLSRMNFIFSFSGIKQFKAKYADAWEPRYLIYRHVLDLPKLGLALSRVSELGWRGNQRVSSPIVREGVDDGATPSLTVGLLTRRPDFLKEER